MSTPTKRPTPPEQAPAVDLIYSRTAWLCCDPDGAPFRPGYIARLTGFRDQGEGRTADAAIESLAQSLQSWVHDWDAEADDYRTARRGLDRVNHFEEPILLCWVRTQLARGTLTEALASSAREPVLDAADERASGRQ